MLSDNFHKIDYLRISVTDRCNLRCIYCLPQDGIVSKPRHQILTFEEILRLASIFSCLGIKKIRLTGGEPLARKGIIPLIKSLSEIREIEEICLTTNGVLLWRYAAELKRAGLSRINLSLDTLKEDKFKQITRNNAFGDVIAGIDKALKLGFHPVKLNMVVMRGINEDEVTDFVDFARAQGLILRFIEFMQVTPLWRKDYFIPIEEVKHICATKFSLKSLGKLDYGPAEYYQVGAAGIIGFIKTSEFNCRHCTRLRLSSTGELKVCLYETKGFCLKELLRSGASDWEIRESIRARIDIKQDIDYRSYQSAKLYMCSIGG